MAIGPIPNIAAMPVKVSPAGSADLPSTHAIAFYPQQQDSSYTPSGQDQQDQQEQSEPERQEAGEQNLMQDQNFSAEVIETKDSINEDLPDDSPAEGTINLFA